MKTKCNANPIQVIFNKIQDKDKKFDVQTEL